MKTVIIAAGTGSRLWPRTDQMPKTLLPFGQGTILSQIISNFATIGLGPRVTFVENRDWQRGNGLSVHLVQRVAGVGSFLLSMSDHLVAPSALARLMSAQSDQNLLLVDPQVDGVF